MIEHAGFAVLTASDGEEAIRLYREHQKEIACVLLDLTMPKRNGEETFRELRRISPDVRVILSSGYSEEAATAKFSPVGAGRFIQKPYQLDTMVAKLRTQWRVVKRKASLLRFIRLQTLARFAKKANPRREDRCVQPEPY